MKFVFRKLKRYFANPMEMPADVGDLAVLGWKHAKRLVILVVGVSVVLLGVAAVLLPVVPGFFFIPIGLAILATEFLWARKLLLRAKQAMKSVSSSMTGKPSEPAAQPSAVLPPTASSGTPPDSQEAAPQVTSSKTR